MPQWSKIPDFFKGLLQKDRKAKLIVLAGVAGMILILASQFSTGGGGSGSEELPAGENMDMEHYAQQLETKLTGLITSVEGVGQAQVMVTLENAGETIYAQEEKRNVDRTVDAEEGGKTSLKENVEQKYILVESSYGQKQPLVKTQLQPKIQGVVIVCEGADDVRVQQRLINVVTTALGIPSTRVCVVKIG